MTGHGADTMKMTAGWNPPDEPTGRTCSEPIPLVKYDNATARALREQSEFMPRKTTHAARRKKASSSGKRAPRKKRAARPIALVVEDHVGVAHTHMLILEECGYRHLWANSAEKAEQMMRDRQFDLLLLDLRLPGKSGAEFLRQLRESGNDTGVIVVTGLHDMDTKVNLLRMGADDFVTKPFKIADLEARIAALARRSGGRRMRTLFGGRITLDPASLSVIAGSLAARLTAAEFGVLWLLAGSPQLYVATARIQEEVFGDTSGSIGGAVKVTVSRLRSKLSEITGDVELKGMKDVGYRLLLLGDGGRAD